MLSVIISYWLCRIYHYHISIAVCLPRNFCVCVLHTMGQTKGLLSLLWQLDKPSGRRTITFTTACIKISRYCKNSTNHCLGQNDFLSVSTPFKSATVVTHTDSLLHFIDNWWGCISHSNSRRSAVWVFTWGRTFYMQRKRYVPNLILSANKHCYL